MPIWGTSELVVGRPGSPRQRSGSAGPGNGRERRSLGSVLPVESSGGEEEEPHDPVVNGLRCSQLIVSLGPSSGRSTPNAAPPLSPSGGLLAPQRPASNLQPLPSSQIYTVQYMGIANGDLGVLTQKQKLTIPLTKGMLGTSRARAPGGISSAPLSRPGSSAPALAGGAAAAAGGGAATSDFAASSPKTPKPGSAVDRRPPLYAPKGSSRRPLVVTPPPMLIVTGSEQAPSPRSAFQSPTPPPAAGDAEAAAPPEGDSEAAAAAVDASQPDEGAHEHPGPDPHQWPPFPGPTPTLATPLGGSPRPTTAASAAGSAAAARAHTPSLPAMVEDATGTIKVVNDCFFSRGLHSRAGPRNRQVRRNRPVVPPVRDKEPLSSALPGRFGGRAPSAGGFPGWKLSAAAAAAATVPGVAPGSRGSRRASAGPSGQSGQAGGGGYYGGAPMPPSSAAASWGWAEGGAAGEYAAGEEAPGPGPGAAGELSRSGTGMRTTL